MNRTTVSTEKHIKGWLQNSFLYSDYLRLRRLKKYYGIAGIRYLLPWHFYLDFVEIPITTKCNLRCPGCANLMPYYNTPYDINSDIIIRSIKKVCDCIDTCGQLRILGGEPFLHPDIKKIISEIPDEKFRKISIPTNATIVPQDPELFELLRKKRVTLVIGNYPAASKTQNELIAKLDEEGVSYELPQQEMWINYGKPVKSNRNEKALMKQFARCNLRSKSLLNGILYYCPRHSHGFDIGIMDRKPGEYVDVLNNSKAQNRRQIRRLMWRHRPIEACKYCLRGTEEAVKISRGK